MLASAAGVVGLLVALLIGVAAGWLLARRGRDRAVAAARDTATTGTFKLADELYARTRRVVELESKLAAARTQGTALKSATEVAAERVHALQAEAESQARAADALRGEFDRLARSLRASEEQIAALRARVGGLEAAGQPRAPEAPAAPGFAPAATRARRAARLPEDPRSVRPEPAGDANARDDLKLIPGVGPALERLLHQHGIHTYRQIANWTRQDVEAMSVNRPALNARIQRDNWIEGARREHRKKYGADP